jgi:hypothetical protein
VWNPFKTLTERDSTRLRRLERTVEDLSDDVEKVLMLSGRVNARLRQRARRALDNGEDGTPEEGPTESTFVLPEAPSGKDLALSSTPLYTKDQMRAFARSRFLPGGRPT